MPAVVLGSDGTETVSEQDVILNAVLTVIPNPPADVEVPNNPDTFDGTVYAIIVAIAAIFVVATVKNKRRIEDCE